MKKSIITLVMCVVIIAVGIGIVIGVSKLRGEKTEAPLAEEKLPNVAVQVLKAELVEDRIVLTGTAEPWETVTISAEISGKIEWQGIDDGDVVEKNAELIRIDTTSIKARMTQAKAEFKLTQQEYNRLQQLQKKLGISANSTIHSYIYTNSQIKGLLMGGEGTMIAKPASW